MKRKPHPAEDRYRVFYHDPENRFSCFYCGSRNEITMDHQPPISRVYDYEALRLRESDFVKVPCCRECNSLLGNELTETLFERKSLLDKKLAAKYRRALKTPYWSGDEVGQLGRFLRDIVESASDRAEWVLSRMEYTTGIQAYADARENSKETT